MIGHNISPLGLVPYPLCAVCTELVPSTDCKDRTRVFRTDDIDLVVRRGQDIEIYAEQDAVEAECAGCLKQWQISCTDFSFESGRYLVFAHEGNVYARILGGRIGQIIELNSAAVRADGTETPINLKLLIES